MNSVDKKNQASEAPKVGDFCKVCHKKILGIWYSGRYVYLLHRYKLVCSVETEDYRAETGEIWLR